MEILDDLQDKVSEGYASANNYFREAKSYVTGEIKEQADELVQLGLNGVRKAEGFFDVPLWGSLVGAVDYNIKDYLTEQLQTELIQRHPEINQLGGEEYAKIINMSNDIMYPSEKMTLQQFWDEWEEKLEDAIKRQSLVKKDREIVETRGYGFTKETATKPYKPVVPSEDSIEFQVQDIPEVDPTPRTWSDEFLASKEPNVNLRTIPDKIIPSEMQASSSPKRFNLFSSEPRVYTLTDQEQYEMALSSLGKTREALEDLKKRGIITKEKLNEYNKLKASEEIDKALINRLRPLGSEGKGFWEPGQAPTLKQDELNPTWYTVKGGDTLSKIAKEYGVSVDGIARANNIKKEDLDRIYPDQKIRIPKQEEKYSIKDIKKIANTVLDTSKEWLGNELSKESKLLLMSVLHTENNFLWRGGMSSSAKGVAQIMPDTAKDIFDRATDANGKKIFNSVEEIMNDPKENIKAAIWYLQKQLKVPLNDKLKKIDRYKTRTHMPFDYALIAYNAGRNVANHFMREVFKAKDKTARTAIGDWYSKDLTPLQKDSEQYTEDEVKILYKAIKEQRLYNTKELADNKLGEVLGYIRKAKGYYMDNKGQ